jgi:hypothetical protein
LNHLRGHALISVLLVACASTQTGSDAVRSKANESRALPTCNRSGPASCYLAPASKDHACDALACLLREDPAQVPYPNEASGAGAALESVAGCGAIEQRAPAPHDTRFREVALLPSRLRDRGEPAPGHASTMLIARADQGWCLIDGVFSGDFWDGGHRYPECPCTRTMRWEADVLDLQTECRCERDNRSALRPEVQCVKVAYKLANGRFHYAAYSSEQASCER